jgi:uncharacterized protein (DUF1015 family)
VEVAEPPYDVMSAEEARDMAAGRENSFLRVDKAEIELPGIDPYDDAVYRRARENFRRMLQERVFIQDPVPMLYIYRLTSPHSTGQTGVAACASIDEYLSGAIRRHELTRQEKELDRVKHIKYCGAHTGPIFLAYRNQPGIDALVTEWTESHSPYCDFTRENVRHQAWTVDDKSVINALVDNFARVPVMYIADGHHRNAAAARAALEMLENNQVYSHSEEFNNYLAVMFPAEQLKILEYNRLVKDLNGLSPQEFLEKIAQKFTVTRTNGVPAPAKSGQFCAYMPGQWFTLEVKPEFIPADPIGALDVSLLQNLVLGPVLGISDPRADKRIDFSGGARGAAELAARVDSGEMAAAFALYPVSMDTLMTIADAGDIMPPKSTWFEPKLLSGLFIHLLDPPRQEGQ